MDERSKVMRKIMGCMRRAINDYDMIADNDHIAVGLSGGKDSLVLLTALAMLRRFSPNPYKLSAVRVDMGFKNASQEEADALAKYCEDLDVDYYLEKTDIAEIIFDVRKEDNPCSLCSKMRRGALNTKCNEIGANKLALGHNADDLVETFLLSFIYEGRLSTFQPTGYMSRTNMTLIRPLVYCAEGDIKGVCNRLNLPLVHNPCPMDHTSQREYMKNLCSTITKDIPFAKDRMFSAITHPERYNLFPPKVGDKNED